MKTIDKNTPISLIDKVVAPVGRIDKNTPISMIDPSADKIKDSSQKTTGSSSSVDENTIGSKGIKRKQKSI